MFPNDVVKASFQAVRVTLSITPVDWFIVESDFDKTLPTLFSSSNIEPLMKYTNLKLHHNT